LKGIASVPKHPVIFDQLKLRLSIYLLYSLQDKSISCFKLSIAALFTINLKFKLWQSVPFYVQPGAHGITDNREAIE